MPATVPFIQSRNNYRLNVPIGGTRYLFDNVHWNSRDNAWYFDLREEDETPIVAGVKVVLGTNLGGLSRNAFFTSRLLVALDTAGLDRDAAYDDLGARIAVVLATDEDIAQPVS